MASSSLTMDARRQQLQQQAASSGVHALPPLAVLPRPDACSLSAISHTPQDDSLAEDLLKRRRLNANPDKSQSSLRKAFTSSKQKAWAPKEIYDALDAHVANSGSPGVAEALIAKLTSTGASLSTPGNKPKANLLSRRKSMGAMSPLRILQKAVENHQTDMVAVLVRHADHFALDAALPIAIRSGDIAILRLLLQYGASASQTAECQDAFRQICIRGGQADIVGLILQSEGRPSPSYLSDCLIDATRKGCIDTVLRLSHSAADGTQREAAALKEAVAKCRVDITLAILTGTKPPTGRGLDETLGRLVAMNSIRPEDRLALAQALLNAGVSNAGAISEALVSVLHIEPLDLRLLDLLLEQGQADVNVKDGSAIVQAARIHDPAILEHVLQKAHASQSTLVHAFDAIADLPTSPAKVTKIKSMLCRTRNQSSLDTAFVKEVRAVVAIPLEPRELGSVQSLLAAGADVNAQQGAALRTAVSAADARVTELLLHAKPNSASLALALPHALKIPDRMNRLTFTEQLIHAGATAAEANRALVHAINKFPDDVSLLRVLASYADVSDGEALSSAVQQARVDIVKILLIDGGQRYSTITLNNIFIATATQIADRPKRLQICNLLLDVGVSGPAVSDALLGAAADGDTALGAALLRKGSASVEHCDGRAIVEACRAGAVDVLAMLLDSPATLKNKTLAQGFQGATQVRDLNKRAQMFHMLLKKGVTGEVVDAQLVSAARFGNEGQPMVKLLLKYGADVNYNNGEAVWTATRSAILGSLALMLGVDGFGRRQKKPLPATIAKALKASWTLSRDPRYQVIQWVLGSASSLTQEQLDTMLVKAVKNEPDLRLVELLLTKGASPDANGCESLIEAAQHRLLDILPALLKARVSETDLAWTFSQAFTPANREAWHADDGYEAMQMLLAKGALGNGSAIALSTAISAYGTNREPVARRFVELLTGYNVDVNHDSGIMLQTAAKRGDQDLVRRLLSLKPNSRTVSMAFPHIFNHSLAEDELLILIKLFTEYRHDQERLDIMSVHPQCQPVMYQALSLFPRSVNLVQALLDAGFYHDHKTMARVMPGDIDEEEQISLFVWALLQPQKRVSDSVLELLIDRGADVNFETRLSKTTPLMLAVQNKRKEVMRKLLLAGAEADVVDATGNTPLTMATKIGGDIGTSMMRDLLIVETFKNDGSLHNAVRELNLAAVEELVEASHELDFPSPLHSGRSALAELCLNAAHTGPLTASQEKAMEKTMTYLISHGTDLTLHASGKSPLLLAFDSVDPLPTTRALLKVGMWKHVNAPSNQYTHDNHVYSPTQYLLRLLPQSDTTVSLISLLYANRAADTYYALTGPQPPDAINPPPDILAAERARTARQEARAFAEQDHRLQLARTRESAELQDQIFLRRVDLEDSKARRELAFLRERGQVEDDLFAAQIRRQRETQTLRLSHETELGQVGARNARMLGDAEAEVQAQKQRGQLEWERQMGAERVKGEKEMAALRVRERGDVDRIDERASKRTIGRIEAQRKLVEKQDALAARFASTGGVRPSQIGWVDELD